MWLYVGDACLKRINFLMLTGGWSRANFVYFTTGGLDQATGTYNKRKYRE